MLALSALLIRFEHYIFKAYVFGRSFFLAFSEAFDELHLQLPHHPLIVILIIITFFQAFVLATEELIRDLIVLLLSLLGYRVHRLVVDAEDLGAAPLSILALGKREN
jgi:hypothetical protein